MILDLTKVEFKALHKHINSIVTGDLALQRLRAKINKANNYLQTYENSKPTSTNHGLFKET